MRHVVHRLNLRTRLTLVSAVSVAVASVLVGAIAYYGVKEELGERVDDSLRARVTAVQAVPVPDVVGLPKQEADERLRAAGFKARFVLPVGSRVVQQSPGPGAQAKRGSEVRLLLNLF